MVKASENLSHIPGTHIGGGENQLPEVHTNPHHCMSVSHMYTDTK